MHTRTTSSCSSSSSRNHITIITTNKQNKTRSSATTTTTASTTTTTTTTTTPIKLSKLQMKGLSTLTLFLITADASLFVSADAAVLQTKVTTASCSAAEGGGECLAAESESNVVSEEEAEACRACRQVCNNYYEGTVAVQIPRGGHGAAASEAASAVVPPPYGIPLNVWKVLLQAFLTCLNVACWYIPLKTSKRMMTTATTTTSSSSTSVQTTASPKSTTAIAPTPVPNKKDMDVKVVDVVVDEEKEEEMWNLRLSLANAFSGGVFLSLAFVHLIPECVHAFPSSWPETAPFGLVMVGYLIIFFVEKMAFDTHEILHEMQSGGTKASQHSHHSHATTASSSPTAFMNGNAKRQSSPPPPSSPQQQQTSSSSGRSAMILLAALGVHSVLEMMALGLADNFRDAALLTGSIALHQPAESIALLVAFVKSSGGGVHLSHAQIVSYLSWFSAMGPIGVALGMIVKQYAAPIVDSILVAIVAGTFVYVGCTEIIPEEWETQHHKWKKFAALMTGILLIVAVTQYTEATFGH